MPLGNNGNFDAGVDDNGERNFPIVWFGSKTVWKNSLVANDGYVYRHAFPNKPYNKPILGTEMRSKGYAGFLYYGRKFCGSDFLDAVMDGRIQIDMFDYTNM